MSYKKDKKPGPHPVFLGDLRIPLAELAHEHERSISYLIRKAVKEFLIKNGKMK